MKDEIWITRDGRKIAVSDMDEQHVRNALRMVIRKIRELREAHEKYLELTAGDIQDILHAEAMQDLKNPNIFFPLLDGGVYGSQALYEKYGKGQ